MAKSMSSQLRLLTLNEGQNLGSSLFRLEKGWTLHFVLGPSLAARNVRVFVNHPEDSKAGPNRHKYRELVWRNLSGLKSDVYDNFAEVHMVLAGSFNYYFTIDGSSLQANADGSGYFVVDPILHVGRYDEKLPLDCLCCQTYLTKSLGPLPEWRGRLQVAKESGYNMIHFTPLQSLGASNSSYSLRDQLQLNPEISDKGKYTMKEVKELVDFMQNDWEVLSLTDLVYNHTANESKWVAEHPECVYNVVNCPHLRPAYALDRAICHFSHQVSLGTWADRGVPANICCEDHLNAMRSVLADSVVPALKIPEYYLLHVDQVMQQFSSAVLGGLSIDNSLPESKELCIVPDPKYRPLKSTIHIPLAVKLFYDPQDASLAREERLQQACHGLRHALEQLNGQKYHEIQSHLEAAISNVIANARWRFLDSSGPKLKEVTVKEPIMYNYFTLPRKKQTLELDIADMDTAEGAYCMAHNGWVIADDPLRNFAEPGSNVYLRRELIPWGDSVKLRYGNKPEDCPYLWEHMRKYTVETAATFHGVRLDNCHSTPIHVAEYMLDEARKVRPDLYVIAELFTSSEVKDNLFINRLGLNSLIREALGAWDSHELGRLVHRYGGYPVGAFIQPPARPLVPCMAHAIFLDQTHDNPSPVEKRSALDLLPSTALVAMASCATGSNRGYDELVPHHINVVTEDRLYQSYTENAKPSRGHVSCKSGLIAAKKALNTLHQTLGHNGFNQVYVDQVDQDIVSVTRHNPTSHQSVILVSRTAFRPPSHMETGHVPPLCVPGVIEEIIVEAKTVWCKNTSGYKADAAHINGLPEYAVQLQEHISVKESTMVEQRWVQENQAVQELDFVSFPPGSLIAFKVSLNAATKSSLLKVRQCLSQFGYRMRTYSGRNLGELSTTELENIVCKLSLNDLSRVLYRCDAEEKDDGKGFGAYTIPDSGAMPYCGIQGVMSILSRIRANNDLGHPLCDNLRNGDWLMDYTANRLKAHPGTHKLGQWLAGVFSHLSKAPRYLIPCYFDAIITGVYLIIEEVAWAKLGEFVRNGSSFVRSLAMGSLQFCSVVKTAPLPIMSPNLVTPPPPSLINPETGKKEQACVSMAAGLPHFASGIFRNWGRDTFIALRGLLLLTKRHLEARFIIMAYAACLRHGLVPNLLGAGSHARYNCRDAIWWWLQCIKEYCEMVPDGNNILADQVARIFPTDDSLPEAPGLADQPLHAVIQEAMQKHAEGAEYRERYAGHAIDNDMSDPGFTNKFGVDWQTGFVYGGNEHNCGTWMDKMGSSDVAGNKGKPATPRDGSAVEMMGLCKSAVSWLASMSESGSYPYPGVQATVAGEEKSVSFREWSDLIQSNFEKYFWIPSEVSAVKECCQHTAGLVNKLGIYKDSHSATQCWADYQLRPNFPIAMVVAPEMFTVENAWQALTQVQEHLLGPLGMKTLDPSDWSYNGFYVNSDNSRGFNYHQGPEWVWPLGFFLRAKLHFARLREGQHSGCLADTVNFIKSTLSRHHVYVQESDWKSLPELTNRNGEVCGDSCPAQAWSMACLLEVLYDMEQLNKDNGAAASSPATASK